MNTSENTNYLAATLVGECRGEPIEGIIGVANVVRNRALAANSSFREICLAPKQFSCWSEDDLNFGLVREILSQLENGNEIKDPTIRQCIAIASIIDDLLDNTGGAKNYVTAQRHQLAKARGSTVDQWIMKMRATVVMGKHVFLIETRGQIRDAKNQTSST